MRIRFKNDPKIWIKYILSLMIMLALLVVVGVWRSIIPLYAAGFLWAIILLVILASLISKAFAKKVYKLGMLFGGWLSKVISYLLLFIIYFTLVVPISLFLRIIGKDLLKRKNFGVVNESYWVKSTPRGALDKMY